MISFYSQCIDKAEQHIMIVSCIVYLFNYSNLQLQVYGVDENWKKTCVKTCSIPMKAITDENFDNVVSGTGLDSHSICAGNYLW